MSKTIVITGTASGLGQASVRRFAAEGWNVVATVRKQTDLSVHQDLRNVRTFVAELGSMLIVRSRNLFDVLAACLRTKDWRIRALAARRMRRGAVPQRTCRTDHRGQRRAPQRTRAPGPSSPERSQGSCVPE